MKKCETCGCDWGVIFGDGTWGHPYECEYCSSAYAEQGWYDYENSTDAWIEERKEYVNEVKAARGKKWTTK